MRIVTLAMLLVTALGMASAHAFVGDALFLPPHADYKTRQTEHFTIVYPREYVHAATKASLFLEESHTILSKAFNYSPGHKCTIILTDNSDFANGVTSAVGLQGIVLYLAAPDPYSSIGEYDDWLRSLIVHEYAHYVTLEQTRGIFEFGRYVFGNLLFPNHVWPTWIAEGLAVYAESVFTKQGRGHGTFYSTLTRDGLVRGTLGTSKFLGFNRFMGTYPDFPFGEAAYYAGYALIDELVVRQGADAPSRFTEESSWRVPYLGPINGTLENISRDPKANTFQALWASWVARQVKELAPELAWLKEQGSGDPQFLSPEGAAATGVRLSPDETKLAYTLTSGHERPGLYLTEVGTGQSRRLGDAIAGAGLSWSADNKKLYFGKSDFDGPYAFYSDLFAYDVESGSTSRLSNGERAKDPDFCVSSQGNLLLYTTQRAGYSELRQLELHTSKIKVLYRTPADHHISNPRCTPDGRSVIFAEHGTEPFEAMYSLSLNGRPGKPAYLFGGPTEGFSALFPEPAQDGSIYFTRALRGYYDLARWDGATRKITLVARSSGGYWFPSLGRLARQAKAGRPTRMAVSYVSSTGIRAALLDPGKLEAATSQRKSPPPRGEVQPNRVAATTPATVSTTPERDYNLLRSLTPRIWVPYITLGDSQNQYGASVLGWDDLDLLEYNIFAWYDSIPRKAEGLFATYQRFATLRLGLSASSQVTNFLTASNNRRIFDEERKFTVRLSRPIPGAFVNIIPAVLAEWARTYRGGDFGSNVFSPEQRLGAELTFDSQQRYTYSVAAERGVLTTLRGRRFFSGPRQAWKGLVDWNQLLPVFPSHSSLSLNGIFAVGPNPTDDIPESFVRVGGSGTLSDLDPPLRGYPLGNFATKRAAIIQAEYRLPLAQVFSGYETWPLFWQNLGVFGFYDAAKLQTKSDSYSSLIDGVGGGLLLDVEVGYNVPLHLRFEFSHGLRPDLNGQNTFTAGLRL